MNETSGAVSRAQGDLDLLAGWLTTSARNERLQARFEDLAAAVPAAVALFTRSRLLFANAHLGRLLGTRAATLPTTPLSRFVADRTARSAVWSALRRAWRGERVEMPAVLLTMEDGSLMPIGLVLTPLTREEEPTMLLVAWERRRDETSGASAHRSGASAHRSAALAHRSGAFSHRPAPAEEGDTLRALGLHLAALAGDLRGPLTAYLGHLDSLTRRADLPADVREAFGLYRQVTDEALRRLTRAMEWGRRDPLDEPVDLRRVIEAALATIEAEALPGEIRIELDLAAVPPVTGNADQLQLAVEHVLRNACEALAGTPDARIDVSLHAEAGGTTLTIADNGPGIPDSIFPHVFEPFSSTKSITNGLGVGLAIVKDVVTRHRGRVALDSSDRGTVVAMVFEPPPARSLAPAAPPARRVLLVDDEVELLETYQALLEESGWDVVTARNAERALVSLGDGTFDVVIIDVQMAGRDGVALVEAIATWRPEVLPRVILNTGYAYEPRVVSVADQHGVTLLEKGCPLAEMLRTMETVARRGR
jgi:signal transduction histidine kinase